MLNPKLASILALTLLGLMFSLLFLSSLGDSAIMDELAHIPAAYSYIRFQDYRLNPEHPPLMKDLAGLPLLFLDLAFPTTHPSWLEETNGQWTLGRLFLYESGNDPGQIIFWARLPMMLLTALFGFLLYRWAWRYYGQTVAVLALFFYAFSPTILAHGRYVTTDIAAAFGFFIGIVTFVRYLENSSSLNNLLVAGLALGAGLLFKFSVVLLIPIYFVLAVIWSILNHWDHGSESAPKIKLILHVARGIIKSLAGALIIMAIAALVIWFVYVFHIWNYPPERQLSDMDSNLATYGFRPAVETAKYLSESELARPLGQYLHGLLMVIQRAAGGNTAYFMGEVSNAGWPAYFPLAYLLKESLGFHLLTLTALLAAAYATWRTHDKSLTAVAEWARGNFILVASFVFIAIYWWQSIRSPLNIGIRHLLPTFPFIYLFVSREIMKWAQKFSYADPQNMREWLIALYEKYIKAAPKYAFIFVMMLWIGASAVFAFPNYLSYYNELAGGPNNGYKYIVDSNYDWGQDLKRLYHFVDKNNIDKIRLDYFGGGSPAYYLGEKYEPWWSAKGYPAGGGWFAVSSNHLMGAQGRPVKGFSIKPEDSYSWLAGMGPVDRAGYSIFIYNLSAHQDSNLGPSP